MSESVPIRRSSCACCLRPQSACICRWIAPVASRVEVLILQHPLEVANPKGSARLLHLSLPNSRLQVGEAFAEAELAALLHAPWTGGAMDENAASESRHPVLLYPDSPGVLTASDSSMRDGAQLRDPARLRLVVLDATWRKSRKMLFLNPLLLALPRLPLEDPPPSRYLVRKAHLPHQLSTLEATCHALASLESEPRQFQPVLDAFDGFIGQQLAYRPHDS